MSIRFGCPSSVSLVLLVGRKDSQVERAAARLSDVSCGFQPLPFPFPPSATMASESQPLLTPHPRTSRLKQTLSPHSLTAPLLGLTLVNCLLDSASYASLRVFSTCQTVRPFSSLWRRALGAGADPY